MWKLCVVLCQVSGPPPLTSSSSDFTHRWRKRLTRTFAPLHITRITHITRAVHTTESQGWLLFEKKNLITKNIACNFIFYYTLLARPPPHKTAAQTHVYDRQAAGEHVRSFKLITRYNWFMWDELCWVCIQSGDLFFYECVSSGQLVRMDFNASNYLYLYVRLLTLIEIFLRFLRDF